MILRSQPRTGARLNIPVWGLFVIALLFVLKASATVLIPVLIALMISMTLVPLQKILMRARIPRALSALLIVILLVTGAIGALGVLKEPATMWMGRVMAMIDDLAPVMDGLRSEVVEAKRTSNNVEAITSIAAPSPRDSITVDVRKPSLLERALSGTPVVLGFLATVLILVYFMLAVGHQSVVAFASALRDSRERKKIFRIVTETRQSISRYLATVSLINLLLGLSATGLFYALGLPDPLLWGAMVALLNFVPYLGSVVSATVVALVSINTFGVSAHAAWAPGLFIVLTTMEGHFITPWILGGGLSLNPLLIFLSIFGLGILWGIPGALIAVPVLVSLAIAFSHIEALAPLSRVIRLEPATAKQESGHG